MKEQDYTSISVNLTDGSFSITGSESFVKEQLEGLTKFMHDNSKVTQSTTSDKAGSDQPKCDSPNNSTTSPSVPVSVSTNDANNKYIQAGICHVDENGNVTILQAIPGSSNKEKVKNIALIVLYMKKTKILGPSLVNQCKRQSCYDSSNYAKAFNDGCFIKGGSGSEWTLELTIPGQREAEKLLEGMVNANN